MLLEIKVYKSIPLLTIAIMKNGESMSLAFTKQYIDRFFKREGTEYQKLLKLFNDDYRIRIQNCASAVILISEDITVYEHIKEVAKDVFKDKYFYFFCDKIVKLKQLFSQYTQDIDEISYI